MMLAARHNSDIKNGEHAFAPVVTQMPMFHLLCVSVWLWMGTQAISDNRPPIFLATIKENL
jgi:hypothetical protein